MEGWVLCPSCKFWKDELEQVSCCGARFCHDCLFSLSPPNCLRCKQQLVLSSATRYRPTALLVQQVLVKCRHESCERMMHPILREHHEKSCQFAPSDKNIIVDALDNVETKEMIERRTQENLFRCYMKEMNCAGMQVSEDGYYNHVIMETDTLPGLALRYSATVQELRAINKLVADNLHERIVLKVPVRGLPNLNTDPKELEALFRKRLISRFHKKTKCVTEEEAVFYLENHQFDIDVAIQEYNKDISWEQKNGCPPWPPHTLPTTKNILSSLPQFEIDNTNNRKAGRNCRSCLSFFLPFSSQSQSV